MKIKAFHQQPEETGHNTVLEEHNHHFAANLEVDTGQSHEWSSKWSDREQEQDDNADIKVQFHFLEWQNWLKKKKNGRMYLLSFFGLQAAL